MATLDDQLHVARRQCSVAVQGVLTDFQFMEEALRMYITAVYQVIHERLGPDIPFSLTYDSLEKDALGKLIDKFEAVSSDAALVKQLRALVPKRNKVSHRGFLVSNYHSADVSDIDKYTAELDFLKKETSASVSALLEAARKIAALTTAAT